MIVMPNIPLFGAFRKLAGGGYWQSIKRNAFEVLFGTKVGRDKEPFLELTVNEFLWGYNSILMTMDSEMDFGGGHEETDIAVREERANTLTSPMAPGRRVQNEVDSDYDWGSFSDNMEDAFDEPWRRRRRKRDTSRVEALNYKQFGFFIGMNGTSFGARTVHTGVGDIMRKGEVMEVAGRAGTRGAWGDER